MVGTRHAVSPLTVGGPPSASVSEQWGRDDREGGLDGIISPMNLHDLTTLLLDGDGVLWRASQPHPALNRFFDVLAARGIRWALLTNNSTATVEDYVSKLRGFGVDAGPQHIYSSAAATAAYLHERFPVGSPVYVFGEHGLKQSIAAHGFVVCEGEQKPDHVVAVVLGMDRALTYGKLTVASQLVAAGVPFIASNADRSFPTPQGITPGGGSLIAAISAVTGVEPVVIGKPEPALFRAAMQHLNAHPETTAMLGDRLDTDILGGQRAGIGTILVLSGVTDRAALAASAIRPDLVYESIAELANDLNHA